MKKISLLAFALSACGSSFIGTWETTSAPADTTSFSEYKQTLVIRSDNTFTRDTVATYTQTSTNPGCIITIVYGGDWSEPKAGTLRFVAKTQKNSTSTACADSGQNYVDNDPKPASGAAAVAQEPEYRLSGSTLELTLSGRPYLTYKKK